MKLFNTRRFWQVFFTLAAVELLLFTTACTAAWITAINGLLPSIAALVTSVLSFVSALEGKTVSAAMVSTIQKWQENVATEIKNAEAILAAYNQSEGSSYLRQLQTVMQAVLTQFQGILQGIDITDSATVSKLTQFVGLGIAAINAVISLIPIAVRKLDSVTPIGELRAYDKFAATVTVKSAQVVRETYASIVEEPTESDDVNAALNSLPRSI
jgi:hypothetical protein